MSIPDEAVEAAARKLDPYIWSYLDRVGEPTHPNSPAAITRDRALTEAREALEAAAPFIAAQALREAADAIDLCERDEYKLRARAVRLEAPSE